LNFNELYDFIFQELSTSSSIKKLSKYKLDLVGLQEVRWEGGDTEPAGEYIFFYIKGNENPDLRTGLFDYKTILSAVKRVEFVSDEEVAGVISVF
jgi:hypothetical protein